MGLCICFQLITCSQQNQHENNEVPGQPSNLASFVLHVNVSVACMCWGPKNHMLTAKIVYSIYNLTKIV
jgi:hypothetical protein